MQIRLVDIPEEGGKALAAKAAEDPWFAEVLQKAFGEDYRKGTAASLSVDLSKTCNNVRVTGDVEVDLLPTCDRCLEPFGRHLSVPIEINLSPSEEAASEEEGDEAELAEDDLNFAFYDGDEIDLGEILRELLALEVPIRDLCRGDCKGLCPRCGQNLNQAPCSCSPTASDPRLAALKKIKLPK